MLHATRFALALALVLGLAGCDANAPHSSSDPALGALRVVGATDLGLDAAGRPHMIAGDAAARLELPARNGRADLLFDAATTEGAPLVLAWNGGPRTVRLSSWAANGRHDLRLDLRQIEDGPATLRVFDGSAVIAEVPVPTGVEFPAGSSERGPTSVHVLADENGNKVIIYDYELAPGGSTTLTSSILGVQNATTTHVAVTIPSAAADADDEHLAVSGARALTVYEARTP